MKRRWCDKGTGWVHNMRPITGVHIRRAVSGESGGASACPPCAMRFRNACRAASTVLSWAAGSSAGSSSAVLCWAAAAGCGAAAAAGLPTQLLVWKPAERDRADGNKPHHPTCAAAARRGNAAGCNIVLEMFWGGVCGALATPGRCNRLKCCCKVFLPEIDALVGAMRPNPF